jgi:cell division protein FtsB
LTKKKSVWSRNLDKNAFTAETSLCLAGNLSELKVITRKIVITLAVLCIVFIITTALSAVYYTSVIVDKDHQISNLEAEAARLDAEVKTLNATIQKLNNEIAQKNNVIAQKK